MAYKRGVLTESNIHKIFISAVYLFHSGNHMKQKLLKLYIVIVFFGYGISAYSQNSDNKLSKTKKWVKRAIFKNLNFLPYIEYLPSVTPSKPGNILLSELNSFEKIINDHIQFEFDVNKELKEERGTRIDEIYDIFRRRRRISRKRKRKDPIEEKISDINYIRGLTQRYETWGPKWDKKTDLAKGDLSFDEIDLIQYELRRLSKKHKHLPFKQKI